MNKKQAIRILSPSVEMEAEKASQSNAVNIKALGSGTTERVKLPLSENGPSVPIAIVNELKVPFSCTYP